MTQKPKIQYIGQFYVHGSEAQVLAAKDKKKKAKTRLPLARLEKIEKIYIDPVALMGIAVAVFMLVVMVIGVLQIQADWEVYQEMSEYVSDLNLKNANLRNDLRSSESYDLADIEAKALALGMVPKNEVQTMTVTLTIPEPEAEATLWDDIVWFFTGLFA